MTSSAPTWKVPGRVLGYWKEAVSVLTAVNRRSAIGLVIGQRATLQQAMDQLHRWRLPGRDPVQITIAGVAFVMVNVDEQLPLLDEFQPRCRDVRSWRNRSR